MSTPEHAHQHPRPHRTPEDVVADVDRRLRRYVGRADRRAITTDLLGDLRAAQADGCDPADLIGHDIDHFVRRTVEESGYAVAVRDTGRIALLGTLWSVPAVVVGYLLALTVVRPLFTAVVSAHVDIPHFGTAGGWAGVGAAGALSVFAAFAVLLQGRPAVRPTLQVAAFTVPIGAAVAVAVNIAVVEGSSITPGTIAVQVAGVLLPLVGAIALARSWGLRRASASPRRLVPA